MPPDIVQRDGMVAERHQLQTRHADARGVPGQCDPPFEMDFEIRDALRRIARHRRRVTSVRVVQRQQRVEVIALPRLHRVHRRGLGEIGQRLLVTPDARTADADLPKHEPDAHRVVHFARDHLRVLQRLDRRGVIARGPQDAGDREQRIGFADPAAGFPESFERRGSRAQRLDRATGGGQRDREDRVQDGPRLVARASEFVARERQRRFDRTRVDLRLDTRGDFTGLREAVG